MSITDRRFLASAPNLTALIEESEAKAHAAAQKRVAQHQAHVGQMSQVLAQQVLA